MPKVIKSTDVPTVTSDWTFYHNGSNHSCIKTDQTVSNTGSSIVKAGEDWMTGWTTPNWRKMRNEGAILPMTPFQRRVWRFEASAFERDYCTANGNRFWYEGRYTQTSGTQINFPADWMVDHQNSLDLAYYVQKAAASIYSSGWDALTFIAELKQLRRMFDNITKRMDQLTRGQTKIELWNLWLEARYGWRILKKDIADFSEALHSTKERRTRYRQQSGHTLTGSSTTLDDEFTSSGITSSASETLSFMTNLRGTVVADIDVPSFQFNPFTTAWEVTRLSFVVDWLLNVGQALEASSFLLATKDYSSCGGYRTEIRVDGHYQLVSFDSSIQTVYSPYGGVWLGIGFHEERVPMAVSGLPRHKLRLNAWKVLDLLSLIAQRVV